MLLCELKYYNVIFQDNNYRFLYRKLNDGIIIVKEYYSIFDNQYCEMSRIFLKFEELEKIKSKIF